MLQKSQKVINDELRRNIWRSLLILKSVPISDLIGVVRGLNTKKARALLRELETHGYLGKTGKGRPEYFQALDSPSLPALCVHCNRPFSTKVCTPKPAKKQTEKKRQTERDRQTETPIKTRKVRKKKSTLGDIMARNIGIKEAHDDAA